MEKFGPQVIPMPLNAYIALMCVRMYVRESVSSSSQNLLDESKIPWTKFFEIRSSCRVFNFKSFHQVLAEMMKVSDNEFDEDSVRFVYVCHRILDFEEPVYKSDDGRYEFPFYFNYFLLDSSDLHSKEAKHFSHNLKFWDQNVLEEFEEEYNLFLKSQKSQSNNANFNCISVTLILILSVFYVNQYFF